MFSDQLSLELNSPNDETNRSRPTRLGIRRYPSGLAPAIDDLIDIGVLGLAFWAWLSPICYGQKRIVGWIRRRPEVQRFKSGYWLATMREHKSFALLNASEYAFSIFPKLEHRHRLHQPNFELKLTMKQYLKCFPNGRSA